MVLCKNSIRKNKTQSALKRIGSIIVMAVKSCSESNIGNYFSEKKLFML